MKYIKSQAPVIIIYLMHAVVIKLLITVVLFTELVRRNSGTTQVQRKPPNNRYNFLFELMSIDQQDINRGTEIIVFSQYRHQYVHIYLLYNILPTEHPLASLSRIKAATVAAIAAQ